MLCHEFEYPSGQRLRYPQPTHHQVLADPSVRVLQLVSGREELRDCGLHAHPVGSAGRSPARRNQDRRPPRAQGPYFVLELVREPIDDHQGGHLPKGPVLFVGSPLELRLTAWCQWDPYVLSGSLAHGVTCTTLAPALT